MKAYEEVLKTTNMNIIGITRVIGIIAPAYSVQNVDENIMMDDSALAQIMESNNEKT